jgi:hypothetical protein
VGDGRVGRWGVGWQPRGALGGVPDETPDRGIRGTGQGTGWGAGQRWRVEDRKQREVAARGREKGEKEMCSFQICLYSSVR